MSNCHVDEVFSHVAAQLKTYRDGNIELCCHSVVEVILGMKTTVK